MPESQKSTLRQRLRENPNTRIVVSDYEPANDEDITDVVTRLIDALDALYWKAVVVIAQDEAPDYMKAATTEARRLLEVVHDQVD